MINISAKNRKNILSELAPDLTPLLDVVFMLIVFLILSVNSALYSLEIELPKDKENVTKIVSDKQNITIYILSKNKGWKIDKKSYKEEKYFRQDLINLAKNNSSLKVMIVSDQDASVAKFINLLTLLEKLKIEKTNIAVEKYNM